MFLLANSTVASRNWVFFLESLTTPTRKTRQNGPQQIRRQLAATNGIKRYKSISAHWSVGWAALGDHYHDDRVGSTSSASSTQQMYLTDTRIMSQSGIGCRLSQTHSFDEIMPKKKKKKKRKTDKKKQSSKKLKIS